MDTEKVILLSGLSFVIVVGAFILFGPSTRPRKRSGQICGLVNLGNTCFLNSLLQALASCPVIVEWLTHYANEKHCFIEALHTVLLVVNGRHPNIFEDPYTPENIIKCLYSKGWTISPEEHDVHELLNVIMTTIEEEIHLSRTSKIPTLADLLNFETEKEEEFEKTVSELPLSEEDGDSVLSSDSDKDYFVNTSNSQSAVPVQEVVGLTKNAEPGRNDKNSQEDSILKFANEFSNADSCAVLKPNDCTKECGLQTDMDSFDSNRSFVNSEEQLFNNSHHSEKTPVSDRKNRNIRRRQSVLTAGIVRCLQSSIKNAHLLGLKGSSVWTVPPCEGLLAGQTLCTRCKYKSPVTYDKFGCISLTLPPSKNLYPSKITLYQLLGKFISPELINDVICEGCEKESADSRSSASSIFKTCNLGKLPPCLIFHIQRTTWQSNGMSKRHDYIEFPEILSMHTYIYNQIQKKMNDLTSVTKGEGSSRKMPVVIDRFKHLYRLCAVIVHKGDVEHGHFVTYRRSPSRPNSWYYISDTEVLESSLTEVLQTSAYMLFYNRCQAN